jgi:hypothetical protein
LKVFFCQRRIEQANIQSLVTASGRVLSVGIVSMWVMAAAIYSLALAHPAGLSSWGMTKA